MDDLNLGDKSPVHTTNSVLQKNHRTVILITNLSRIYGRYINGKMQIYFEDI